MVVQTLGAAIWPPAGTSKRPPTYIWHYKTVKNVTPSQRMTRSLSLADKKTLTNSRNLPMVINLPDSLIFLNQGCF